MSFQKFVHRHTRAVFLFIAITMILPLVLWGYMGRMGSDKDADEVAGIIKTEAGPVKIYRGQFNQQKQRAYPSFYLKLYRQIPQYAIAIAFRGQRPPEAKADEITKLAWRNLVLLEDAKVKGIPEATETEINQKSRKLFEDLFFGRIPVSEGSTQGLFRASAQVYNEWIKDLVVIDKLLDTMAAAEFAEYEKIYDRLMGDQQSVRVTFAALDPKDFVKELKPPRTDEIAKYYQENKAKFRAPEKVVIAYLLADLDELKKSEPEPTEEAIKKYYEDHKSDFLKPAPEHKHAPGEEHKEDEKPAPQEPKPLEEVRGEIPDKIKRKAAEDKVSALFKDLNTDLGQEYVKNNNKYPENVLYDLREKVEREKSIKLIHDVTTPFDRRHVEEVEKIVGSGGGLESWAFDAKRAEGDISNIVSTSKGRVFFKIQKKIAANDNPGVTAQNRETIVKELQKEQLRKRAQAQASAMVDEIKTHGIAAVRAKYSFEWRTTRYFKTQFNRGDPGADDPGIDDRTLGRAISSHVAQFKKAGEASVLQGSMVGGEKRDWAYVVYVDDVLASPPADFDAKFLETRHEMDQNARKTFEQQYGDKMVLLADIQDFVNKKDASGAPSTPEPSTPEEP